MTGRLVCGLMLTAALAMPVSFPNPFKKKTPAVSKVTKVDEPSRQKAEPEKEKKVEKAGFSSVYAGGSVAYIPQHTAGKLDLSDSKKLQFHFDGPTWALDYSRIATIEVSDRKQVRLLKVPYLMKDQRVLQIAYYNDKGYKQSAWIEMPVEDSYKALPLLEERTGKQVAVEGQANGDGWWGDRYWRTARSAQTWDEVTGQNKTAVASAKDE